MSEPRLGLNYRYGSWRRPQASPVPVGDERVALLVGDLEVWAGEVTEEVCACARWCALQVASKWDCPAEVRAYLERGDEVHRVVAGRLASAATSPNRHSGSAREAARAAWYATWPNVSGRAAQAAQAAGCAFASEAGPRRLLLQERAAARLREAFLRRALPERHHRLIGGDEPALFDALARGRLRFRWTGGVPMASPVPQQGTQELALLVGGEVVWRGEAEDVLVAWGRACALRVSDVWACPDIVRQYLETSDDALRSSARAEVPASGWTGTWWKGDEAARAAAAAAVWAPEADASGVPWDCAGAAAVDAARAAVAAQPKDCADREAEWQAVQLRTRLLRRVL
ncbi:MAG: hypothetical protein R3F59_39075, partial [Myxococcota bacterium]